MTATPHSTHDPTAADRAVPATLLFMFVGLSLTAYLGLAAAFGFPDILRAPAPKILEAFRASEAQVRGFYYLFAVSHLLFAAAVLTLPRALSAGDGPWLTIATGGGVLYGVAQTMGFLRWPILIPVFANHAAGHDLSGPQGKVVLLMLEAFHHYAGNAIGENLSFWGMCAWLIGTGIALRQPGLGQKWIGWLWIGTGLMVGVYTFEQLGGPFAVLGPLLLISHGLAYGLILALAWSLVRTRSNDRHLAPVGGTAALAIAVFSAAIVLPGLWG